MKIWNFKKQDLEEGVEPPGCNGIVGKHYQTVNINYNGKYGETKIEYFHEKEKNERKI